MITIVISVKSELRRIDTLKKTWSSSAGGGTDTDGWRLDSAVPDGRSRQGPMAKIETSRPRLETAGGRERHTLRRHYGFAGDAPRKGLSRALLIESPHS